MEPNTEKGDYGSQADRYIVNAIERLTLIAERQALALERIAELIERAEAQQRASHRTGPR